ncbi:PAS domain S-box protein, partial [Thermodesulfobacteriota bacterium]
CRDFLESIDEGVYETDIYGDFTFFNDALCEIFGYPRGEIIGKNFSKFMDKKKAREALGTFTKIWVTHNGFTDIIWEIKGGDGAQRILELSAHLITDEKGEKTGFRGIARDVSEKHKMIEELKEIGKRYQREVESNRRSQERTRDALDFVPYPMVVSSLEGKVRYVNPAFTRIFGWTLDELRGKTIPYVPPDLAAEAKEKIKKLLDDKADLRYKTKRITKDGRILDVIMKGTVPIEGGNIQPYQVVILRDITDETRSKKINEAILRISTALPQYPELEDLLDYISEEIMHLLNTERALVMLLDEERNELFFQGAADDDAVDQIRVKQFTVPADKSIAGRVIRTGEPTIIQDAAKEPDFYQGVGKKLGYQTENLIYVPLRSHDRIIGVLSARNKKEGGFDQTDVDLLNMIAGTVSLSIENARYSDELKAAYNEVTGLNRAKDKVINHLSHELKTPVSVLLASLNILSRKLEPLPKEKWSPAMDRAMRNLDRIIEIQYEVEDIMQDKEYNAYHLLTLLLEQCTDELEALVEQELGEGDIIQRIRDRIEEIFGPKKSEPVEIQIDSFVKERLDALRPVFSHRTIEIFKDIEDGDPVFIPPDVLKKIIDGLVRNAVENTPDGGKIELLVKGKGDGMELQVKDYGIGITDNDKGHIFEGFFSTQETMDYSSKRPFDFNAGGKGADLLRMKIFSERYNFQIKMESNRCGFIPGAGDICPGEISKCGFCKEKADCYSSGGTKFTLFFPSKRIIKELDKKT